MKRMVVWIVVLLALGPWARAWGWNNAGHMAIASIVYDELSGVDRTALLGLLKEHPRFKEDLLAQAPAGRDQGAVERWVFMRAACWPDLARTFHGEDQQKYSRPQWHFIDWPVFVDAQAEAAIHPPELELDYRKANDEQTMNAVQALNKALDELNDKQAPASHRAVALCWVLHLTADIHQPLHCATLYAAARFRELPVGDKGGNMIPVHEAGADGARNLHWLWDAMLGKDDSYEAAVRLAGEIKQEYPRDKFVEAIKQTEAAAWAEEGNKIAGEKVYIAQIRQVVRAGEAHPHAPLEAVEITDDYLKSARSVARERAALAAYRAAVKLGS